MWAGWFLAAALVWAGAAEAQTRPVVSFRLEVAGHEAVVRQLSVSANVPAAGSDASYDPITLSVTTGVDQPDAVLGAWFDEGATAARRAVDVRLLTVGGSTGVYHFENCGLSARSFGDLKFYVTRITAGRVGRGLPQSLQRCGYKTFSLYPSYGNFLGARSFQKSTGVGHFMDLADMGAAGVVGTF